MVREVSVEDRLPEAQGQDAKEADVLEQGPERQGGPAMGHAQKGQAVNPFRSGRVERRRPLRVEGTVPIPHGVASAVAEVIPRHKSPEAVGDQLHAGCPGRSLDPGNSLSNDAGAFSQIPAPVIISTIGTRSRTAAPWGPPTAIRPGS